MSGDVANYYRKIIRAKGWSGEDAEAILHRVLLIAELKEIIKSNNWTQKEAALRLRVSQPRVAEINKVCIDKFSTDLLIKYLYRLQRSIKIEVISAAAKTHTS